MALDKGLLYLALNFLSSVSIVFVNKMVFKWMNFPYGATLSTIHFATTSVGLFMQVWIGMIKVKRLPIVNLLTLSLVYALSVPFCNFSIRYNSLGFYQISKVTIIPTTIAISYLFYSGKLNKNMAFYIVPILSGSYLTAKTDIQTTPVGILMAVSCVVSSAVAQMWIKSAQAEYEIDASQLLIYVMPVSVVIQAIFIPVFDDMKGLLSFEWDYPVAAMIALSAILAFSVNFTIFLALRNVTPVTYQIVGQAKSVTILVGSFILFGQQIDALNLLGMSITMAGVFYYTYTRIRSSGKKSDKPLPTTNLKDDKYEPKEDNPKA